MRVLIVEDEPYMAEAIRDGLRLEAIAADIAGDGGSRDGDGAVAVPVRFDHRHDAGAGPGPGDRDVRRHRFGDRAQRGRTGDAQRAGYRRILGSWLGSAYMRGQPWSTASGRSS